MHGSWHTTVGAFQIVTCSEELAEREACSVLSHGPRAHFRCAPPPPRCQPSVAVPCRKVVTGGSSPETTRASVIPTVAGPDALLPVAMPAVADCAGMAAELEDILFPDVRADDMFIGRVLALSLAMDDSGGLPSGVEADLVDPIDRRLVRVEEVLKRHKVDGRANYQEILLELTLLCVMYDRVQNAQYCLQALQFIPEVRRAGCWHSGMLLWVRHATGGRLAFRTWGEMTCLAHFFVAAH